MEKIALRVEGMSCGHCKNAVESAVGAIDGVKSVTAELESKTVTVEYDSEKTGPEAFRAAIEAEDYEVVG